MLVTVEEKKTIILNRVETVKKTSWREIESKADSVFDWFLKEAKRLGVDAPSVPPIPINEICALRGLSVNEVSSLMYRGKKLAGMLDAGSRAISVEAKDILGRQRFSAAHELGHYELHCLTLQVSQMTPTLFPLGQFIDEADDLHFRCSDEDMELQFDPKSLAIARETAVELNKRRIRESEANQFAAFLLMPEYMIRDWAKRLQGDLRRLAYQFEVSPTAMRWRLTNLKMETGEEDSTGQQSFFFRLSSSPASSTDLPDQETGSIDSTEPCTQSSIVVTPETRLRTLISEVDAVECISQRITLDLTPFETGELGAIGPAQALDLVLLNDYILECIIPRRTVATENIDLAVQLPSMNSYVPRHLSRLGVFEYLQLAGHREAMLLLPKEPFAASGASVLLPLTKIQSGIDPSQVAQSVVSNFARWAEQSATSQRFSDLLRQVLIGLAQNIVQHSGTQPGSGKGYAVAQFEPVGHNQVTGYRVLIAVGDIGIGVRNGLAGTRNLVCESDFEALYHCLEGPTMSQFKRKITHDWYGHLQLNSGDAMLSIGERGTLHLTGLYPVPGLQVSVLMECPL